LEHTFSSSFVSLERKLEEEIEALKQQQCEQAQEMEKAKEQAEKEKEKEEPAEKEESEDVRKTIAFMRHNLSINTRELER
jgi:hypothetical protein